MAYQIGILSLQGATRPHAAAVEACGARARFVRLPEEIDEIDALIIPGGESTTMGILMRRFGIGDAIAEHAHAGKPVFGTCAGLIVLAKGIAESDQARLGLMDICVVRNSFGRQVDSFEAPLTIPAIGDVPFRGVFIRAPHVESVDVGVHVLAEFEGRIVLVRQGNLLGASFHPELTDDLRLHEYFLKMIASTE